MDCIEANEGIGFTAIGEHEEPHSDLSNGELRSVH